MPWRRCRTVSFWLVLILVIGGGVYLRAAYDWIFWHPDESITIAVVAHLRQAGDLDTDWALAEVPEGFHYHQYNFSTYHLCLYFFYRLVELVPALEQWRLHDDGLKVYRLFSALMAAIALVQVVWIAWRTGGRTVALVAGILAAVTALLVQDAYFARPETLTVALTLGAVALSRPAGRGNGARVLAAAFLVGLLIACKVSMLALAWMPFVPMVARWRQVRRPVLLAAAVPFALALGFAAGAPAAVLHPASFLNGIEVLSKQYSGEHAPHGHYPDTSRWVADLVARYFVAMLGWPILVAAAVGSTVLAVRRQWATLALLAGPVILFTGFFMTRTVFFERNLSHVVPLLLVLSAVGTVAVATLALQRLPAAVPVAATALALGAAVRPFTVTRTLVFDEVSGAGLVAQNAYEAGLRRQYPQTELLREALLVDSMVDRLADRMREQPAPFLLCVIDFNDEWTPACVQRFLARFDAKEVADRTSCFAEFPVCTLFTYHRANERYFLVTSLK